MPIKAEIAIGQSVLVCGLVAGKFVFVVLCASLQTRLESRMVATCIVL